MKKVLIRGVNGFIGPVEAHPGHDRLARIFDAHRGQVAEARALVA